MNCFDVAIIGGGPAGASLAISLRHRGLSVFVAERSEYQQWRAGEALSSKVSISLSKLGVMNVLLETPHIASQAIRSSWGSSNLVENHSITNPYGTGWLVGRSEFDSNLMSEAENLGALVSRGTNYVSASRNDLWQIILRNAFGSVSVRAKLLVDASGRVSQVARSLGAKAIFHDSLIAIIGILSPNRDEVVESVLTLEATEDGWWYNVPLPNGRVIAAFMTDRDIFLHRGISSTSYWSEMIKRSQHLSHLFEKFCLANDVVIKNASTFRLDKFAGRGWLAVGDAACAFDPLAGNGVLKALDSGIASSEAISLNILDNTFGNYSQNVALIFDNYLIGRRDYYKKEQRWIESPFWRRRHLQ